MRLPSCEKATLETGPSPPRKTAISFALATSHRRTVPLFETVMMRSPSGENSALLNPAS